ncbi:hypothetical protein SAMN05421858_5124 [Haladaptatus litoreus]|uniref:Uncharacterized protein n=1 Tax=Haladaptatus litoreus TaxID=553468 RepID=A0A1N7FJN7_9EURY|nr:hypothetical protein SAMN05421858_5124 [Haladaptatus litoreus]
MSSPSDNCDHENVPSENSLESLSSTIDDFRKLIDSVSGLVFAVVLLVLILLSTLSQFPIDLVISTMTLVLVVVILLYLMYCT